MAVNTASAARQLAVQIADLAHGVPAEHVQRHRDQRNSADQHVEHHPPRGQRAARTGAGSGATGRAVSAAPSATSWALRRFLDSRIRLPEPAVLRGPPPSLPRGFLRHLRLAHADQLHQRDAGRADVARSSRTPCRPSCGSASPAPSPCAAPPARAAWAPGSAGRRPRSARSARRGSRPRAPRRRRSGRPRRWCPWSPARRGRPSVKPIMGPPATTRAAPAVRPPQASIRSP